MAETTFPGQLNTFRDEWPGLVGHDGIIEDYDGSAFGMTTSGSSPEVTITPGSASQPIGRYRVAGFVLALDSAKTLNLTTDLPEGVSNPTAGQKRVDRIVARYDWSKPASAAASIEIAYGVPVATTVPDLDALPELKRTIGDVWESPLRWVSRPSGGVVTANGSERRWAVDEEIIGNTASIEYPPAPIGRKRRRNGQVWVREYRGATLDWYRELPSLGLSNLPRGDGTDTTVPTGSSSVILAIVPMTGTSAPAAGVISTEVSVELSSGGNAGGFIWLATTNGSVHGRKRFGWLGGKTEDMVSWTFLAPSPAAGINLQVVVSTDPASQPVTFRNVKVDSQLLGVS